MKKKFRHTEEHLNYYLTIKFCEIFDIIQSGATLREDILREIQ